MEGDTIVEPSESTDIQEAVTTIAFNITTHFGWVFIVLFLEQVLNFFLIFRVMKARKEFNIEYPNLYADRTIDGDVKAN